MTCSTDHYMVTLRHIDNYLINHFVYLNYADHECLHAVVQNNAGIHALTQV